jgi:hypothetical protein
MADVYLKMVDDLEGRYGVNEVEKTQLQIATARQAAYIRQIEGERLQDKVQLAASQLRKQERLDRIKQEQADNRARKQAREIKARVKLLRNVKLLLLSWQPKSANCATAAPLAHVLHAAATRPFLRLPPPLLSTATPHSIQRTMMKVHTIHQAAS